MSIHRPIEFTFDFDKFLHLIAYLSRKVSDFDVLKAVKLLYFIDKHHLIRHGRLITGDSYYNLDYGPVPTRSYELLKGLKNDAPVDINQLPDKKRLIGHLEIDETKTYPTYHAKKEPDMGFFSKTELESISSVINTHGQLSSVALMDKSHEDATHKQTGFRKEINFHLFFEGDPEARQDALERMEFEQEDRDFVNGLTA